MSKYMVNKAMRGILILSVFQRDLVAGQSVNLKEEHFKDAQVRLAIKQGFLVSMEEEPKEEVKVAEKSVEKANPKIIAKKDEKPKAENEEPKTIMSSWDAFSGELADKDASKKLVSEQMKSKDLPAVKTIHVDIEESEESISVEKIKDAVKKMAKRRTPKKRKPAVDKTKVSKEMNAKKLQKIKRVQEEIEDMFVDSDKQPADVGFVDQEQDVERLKKHPVLSKKVKKSDSVEQNGEVS